MVVLLSSSALNALWQLLERGWIEGRAEMEAKLKTQRLHEAELQKELERMLETRRLVHEAERQQLLARLKAVELGGK